jgi:hypothetical protein
MPKEKIKAGSVIFLYNINDKSLLGPFTALSEGVGAVDTGAWAMDIDEHSASERESQMGSNRPKSPEASVPERFKNLCVIHYSNAATDLLKTSPFVQERKNKPEWQGSIGFLISNVSVL